jgi:hypothetical protein
MQYRNFATVPMYQMIRSRWKKPPGSGRDNLAPEDTAVLIHPALKRDRGIRLCPPGPLGLRISRRKGLVYPAKSLRILGVLVFGNPL